MNVLEHLHYRALFAGIPFGELQSVVSGLSADSDWLHASLRMARKLKTHARIAENANRKISAAQLWQWTASAYHIASFGYQFKKNHAVLARIGKLRRLAHLSYLKSIQNASDRILPVAIPYGGSVIRGYLRRATPPESPLAVLFNGLDSLCEVELHSFGSWMLNHGISVLAIDLPACFTGVPRKPRVDVENLAPFIADWAEKNSFSSSRLGAFGVSFGGYLVARFMSGDSRFRCGVAVSPPAYLGEKELRHEKIRWMLAWSFNLKSEPEIDQLCSAISLASIPRPEGKLLVLEMGDDRIFDHQHIEEFQKWGGDRVETRHRMAEHVGTSQIHYWLPDVSEWMYEAMSENTGGIK